MNISFKKACKLIETKLYNTYGDVFKAEFISSKSPQMRLIETPVLNHFSNNNKHNHKTHGALVISLIPDSDTTLYSEYAIRLDEIRNRLHELSRITSSVSRIEKFTITPHKDSFTIKCEIKDNQYKLSLLQSWTKMESKEYVIFSTSAKMQNVSMSGKIERFMDRVDDVKLKKIPMSILLLNKIGKNVLEIKYGYTFKRARNYGLSTLLRKLLQVYAYENDIKYITTTAVAWGSQIGSKKAGMFQFPVSKSRIIWNKVPDDLKNKLRYDANNNKTHSAKVRNSWSRLSQKKMNGSSIKNKYKQRPNVTPNNIAIMKQYYGNNYSHRGLMGQGLLINNASMVNNGNDRVLKLNNGTQLNGTHMRKLSRNKIENIITKLSQES